MRRLPVLPTLVVALAVAAMIALGIWQLQRARWKEGLLAQYAAAASLPAVDLDPLLERRAPLAPLSFRRALVSCTAEAAEAEIRAGRNLADEVGQAYVIPCRPGAGDAGARIRVNVGWSARPDGPRRISLRGLVAGRLGAIGEDGPITLVAATPVPPLAASRPPSLETIPNNHRLYALQWFLFAAAALIIYLLALRKRNRADLPPEP